MASGDDGSAGVIPVSLVPAEIDAMIDTLKYYPPEQIASPAWLQQHDRMERLTLQALLDAKNHQHESVKEAFARGEQSQLVVQDLLTIEAWKTHCLPIILKTEYMPVNNLPINLAIHHEGTCMTLLETLLYYRDIAETLGDFAIELIDYCHRKITKVISNLDMYLSHFKKDLQGEYIKKFLTKQGIEERPQRDIQMKVNEIDFQLAMKAIAIVSMLADHSDVLPVGITVRILDDYDFPCLYVGLLEEPPWLFWLDDGQLAKWDVKWTKRDARDKRIVTKLEGQVWLALFRMLIKRDFQSRYEWTEFRRSRLLKLKNHVNEVLIDQIPPLSELQRYLSKIEMGSVPTMMPRNMVIEEVPLFREHLLRDYKSRWATMAPEQAKNNLNLEVDDLKKLAEQLSKTYDTDVLTNLLPEKSKCTKCGQEANKRCSRCKTQWYCRRECQVAHWKEHRYTCDYYIDQQKRAVREKEQQRLKQKQKEEEAAQREADILREEEAQKRSIEAMRKSGMLLTPEDLIAEGYCGDDKDEDDVHNVKTKAEDEPDKTAEKKPDKKDKVDEDDDDEDDENNTFHDANEDTDFIIPASSLKFSK